WVRAIRALPSFRGDSAFSTWLHRIAVNSALHGQRWRTRRTSNEIPLPVAAEASRPADRPVLRIELERALRTLPPGMRQVLVLHDVEGYTHDEIAEGMGITSATSKSQLFQARAKLRGMLSTSARDAKERAHVTSDRLNSRTAGRRTARCARGRTPRRLRGLPVAARCDPRRCAGPGRARSDRASRARVGRAA